MASQMITVPSFATDAARMGWLHFSGPGCPALSVTPGRASAPQAKHRMGRRP